jgi:hypothetical protein
MAYEDQATVGQLADKMILAQANGSRRYVVEVYDPRTGEWEEHPIDHFRVTDRMA